MNAFYHGDCLFVMKHDIEPNSIDLIYLDPPFFTGKVQKGTAKWQPSAMEVSYEDSRKFWGDTEKVNAMRTQSPEWLKHIAQTRPDFAAYLFYMMERLEACHGVLKDTGSIYLHCDEKASHYLKMIMDDLFVYTNFRNEVIWFYNSGARRKLDFGKRHDTILRYSKTDNYILNNDDPALREPYSPNINIPKCKEHYYNSKGKVIGDIWRLPIIAQNDKQERVGYPTQKPLALLERIIKASSNEGDVILDPFCGCGTAIIAAQRLHRQWIGIDINTMAHEISGQRIGELPLDFKHYEYVSRDLDEVLAIKKPTGKDSFEEWVNGYFKAHKPNPDEGIDGITQGNIPIQTKTFSVNAKWVRNLFGDAILHPQVKKPCKHVILVSQIGFDDGARQQQSKIQTKEGITIELLTPTVMLNTDGNLQASILPK